MIRPNNIMNLKARNIQIINLLRHKKNIENIN